MFTVKFENRKYRLREIEIEGEGTRIIGSTVLNNKLLTNDGHYKSDKARFIDEQIYFFVEPAQLKLNDNELVKFVKEDCV